MENDTTATGRDGTAEPIAVIGFASELPGGLGDTDAMWGALLDGRCTSSPLPSSFRAGVAAASYFDEVGLFDAAFFGISPKEAKSMDPQHRFILRTAWRALENAGIPIDRAASASGGVFIGLSSDEYMLLSYGRGGRLETYAGPGTHRSMAAGRISYILGWNGPAMQVDTACSSSLVAVHLACQSLRGRECAIALAAGAHIFLRADAFEARGNLNALSPGGRCKPFSSCADGFGVGEGVGAVVLKRLADAEAAGDRVHAVILGSAVNHNGMSIGLTAPSAAAQAAVIDAALRAAGVAGREVHCIEAHGTGTQLGDPIELAAISQAYGQGRSKPLEVGSVKGNFGHTEAAAGIVSLIKACMAVEKGIWPRSVVHGTIAPDFDRPANSYRISAKTTRWPAGDGPRLAAVSSFGMSGTNCHLILQQARAPSRPPTADEPCLVVLSAKSDSALAQLASAYAAYLRSVPVSLSAFAWTLARRRSHFSARRALFVADLPALLDALDRLAAEQPARAGNTDVNDTPTVELSLDDLAPLQSGSQTWCAEDENDFFLRCIDDCLEPSHSAWRTSLLRDARDAIYWTSILPVNVVSANNSYGIQLKRVLQAISGKGTKLFFGTEDAADAKASRVIVRIQDIAHSERSDENLGEFKIKSNFLETIKYLYECGLTINWKPVFYYRSMLVDVPGHPFAERMHWIGGTEEFCYGPTRR